MKKLLPLLLFFVVPARLHFILMLAGGLCIVMVSCKKGSGEGGRASIKGKVYAVNYDNSLITPLDSGYLGGQKVYIIYGEETAVGDNQDSNNDGAFEFTYLRKGKYKVFTYSKTKNGQLDSAVVQEVEVTERKQTFEMSDLKIKTVKN